MFPSSASSSSAAAHPAACVSLRPVLNDLTGRLAWQRVLRAGGAPGTDGQTVESAAMRAPEIWRDIQRRVRSGAWQPAPLRRVTLPKPGGGMRLLGIPTVADRWLHQAITLCLTTVWDPVFSARSFGYRPARGVRQAITQTCADAGAAAASAGALHLDIADFFDSVPHSLLLAALAPAVSADLLALIRVILTAPVQKGQTLLPHPAGLHQGSPLSPLLANIMLHPLDRWLEALGCRFSRYADDCLITQPGTDWILPLASAVCQPVSALGLRLHPEKSRAGQLADMDYLGFSFRTGAAGRAVPCASEKAAVHFRASLAEILRASRRNGAPCPDIARPRVIQFARQWAAYYSFGGAQDPIVTRCMAAAADAMRRLHRPRLPGATLPGYQRPARGAAGDTFLPGVW